MKKLKSASILSVQILALAIFVFGARGAAHSAGQKHLSKHPFVHVDTIFREHCVSCHNDARRAEGLSLTSFAAMMKGGEHGPIVVAGHPEKSRLLLYINGKKQPRMPYRMMPLSKTEISMVSVWIKSGARP